MQNPNNKKLISVIICTYNRCESLRDTLESLLKQENDGSFTHEIVVIDNNSSDNTREVVLSYESRIGDRMRYFIEKNQGLSFARNRGIVEAKGDFIVFTDDDVLLDKNWIKNIYILFTTYPCDAMGGRVLPYYPPNAPRWITENQDILNGPIVSYDYGETIKMYDKTMLPFVGATMAFQRKIFDECGTFRNDIGAGKGSAGEDTEYFRRLEKKGKKIYYNGKALAFHKVEKGRMNLRYIANWNITAGRYYVLKDKEKGVGQLPCLGGGATVSF